MFKLFILFFLYSCSNSENRVSLKTKNLEGTEVEVLFSQEYQGREGFSCEENSIVIDIESSAWSKLNTPLLTKNFIHQASKVCLK